MPPVRKPILLALTALALLAGAWAFAQSTNARTTDPPATTAPADTSSLGTASIPILLYHHIAAGPKHGSDAPLYVPPALFKKQIASLATAGYHAVTLDEVFQATQTGTVLPGKAIVVSFDDGYGSQYRSALPTLKARGWPAVLNLIVHNPFPDKISTTQVKSMLAAGWELDAHTLTHPDLTKVSPTKLVAEVADSRTALMAQYGEPVNFLAYPYGHVNAAVVQAVQDAGFAGATTTTAGAMSAGSDPYHLPRVIVSPKTTGPALVAKLAKLKRGR